MTRALATDLAIDLDGSLLRTDSLHEAFVRALFTDPWLAVRALFAALRGRFQCKQELASLASGLAGQLPARTDLVDWLKIQAHSGRRLHLVTAAHEDLATAIGERFGFFQSVIASKGGANLKGEAKRDRLCEEFPQGFAYVGDASADMSVFAAADSIVLAGASPSVRRQAMRLNKPMEAEFQDQPGRLRDWIKALRLHQWSKNVLMVVPLLLSGAFAHLGAVLDVALGFVAMGLVASGTYILNDLSDLAADRAHPTKRTRPFASCRLSIRAGLSASAVLIASGLAMALALSGLFAALVLAYTVATLSYSFALKKVALLDVSFLAALYTLRLAMGAALAQVPLSDWLLVFSLFFFLSLSLAKRHVEIAKAAESGVRGLIPGRGYRGSDGVVTLPLGMAAAMTSLLVMVLFLVFEAFTNGGYANPKFLWAGPLLVFLWLARVWLLASRGELNDDPVAFAVRDRQSLALGAVLGVFTLLAVLPWSA